MHIYMYVYLLSFDGQSINILLLLSKQEVVKVVKTIYNYPTLGLKESGKGPLFEPSLSVTICRMVIPLLVYERM